MSVIGVDVDGTLALGKFIAPEILGEPNLAIIEVIKILHKEGHTLCAWSCRADYVVKAWLMEHELLHYFTYINKSPYVTDSIKPSFDIYIGDEVINSQIHPEHILSTIKATTARGDIGVFDELRDRDFSSQAPVPFLAGTGRMYIDMFEELWRNVWEKHDPKDKSIALLTICSHAKPYSKSFIHSTIRKRLYEIGMLDKIQYAHISTAGIIPSEAEMVYPFNAYDHDGSQMTEDAKQYFSERTFLRIRDWLAAFGGTYERVVFYLRGEGKTYRAAIDAALATGAVNVIVVGADMGEEHYLPFAALRDTDDCLTSGANLNKLLVSLKDNY